MSTLQIRSIRKAKGLTQAQVAERVGVDTSAVAHWEAGGSPRSDRVPLIASALDCTIAELYGEGATTTEEDQAPAAGEAA